MGFIFKIPHPMSIMDAHKGQKRASHSPEAGITDDYEQPSVDTRNQT